MNSFERRLLIGLALLFAALFSFAVYLNVKDEVKLTVVASEAAHEN